MDYLNQGLALARQGFDTVNSVQGIVIAVIAAGLMRNYGRVIGWAIGATVVHEAVNIVRHILAHDANPVPNFADMEVLKLIAVRFVGYFVAISIIYFVRRLFFRS
ncbi:MAG TPA: hypothetical protein PKA57_06195 [Parvibaculum sp.]|uniref:hypothetical protein n=1 Tax=Parvibaculum sp. TaxID=2024848 RepID=UPI002B6526F5|nr:hypothetical protein [Parvibaculum sp.]HMM14202.1 hypothetical protein [Parvibaculum sp.]